MQEITSTIANVCQELFQTDVSVELTRPDEQFGDFASNVALQLSRQLGKNPREIGQAIAASLKHDAIASVDVAGPGFLNIRLTDKALLAELRREDVVVIGADVVIETNNPNPFKAMHIGHAFNAILADTIANLLDANRAAVHRVSYHGDVGAHVGKSMYSLLKFIDGDVTKLEAIPLNERNTFMSRMYAEGATAYKEDEAAKVLIDQLAQQSFLLDDPLFVSVYQICKSWSFEQIDAIVSRLGNKPITRRYLESEADTLGVETVRAHVPDVFAESDGALVFEGSKYGAFDNAFVSSTGRGLYAARDLGLMQLKNQDFPQSTKSYIVTAEEQRDYFKGVIKAAELCLPQLTGVTTNISTGTVKLSTGKMSSRSGDVLEINWLFEQIAEAIRARGSAVDDTLIAGALRYQFLKVRIGSDVVFDVSEAVNLQGNTGPYLQYAYARACSILAKTDQISTEITDLQPGERSLVRKLTEYRDTVTAASNELLPHYICTYLYELAQGFNRFYEHNRVIGDEREAVRLNLVQQYATVLKNGLELLGIAAPEHM